MAQQDECAELTWDQLDLVILGQIMANITLDDVGRKSGHTPVSRTRSYVAFYHHGYRICRDTFLQLHGIGNTVLYT